MDTRGLTMPTTMPGAQFAAGGVFSSMSTAGSLSRRQSDFAAVLGQARAPDGAQTPEAKARAAAEDFVAIALVQPILKQLRQSNQTPPPFGPGEGEKALGGLADAQVAKAIVRRGRFGVVDTIEQQMLGKLRARAAAQAGAQEAEV